MTCAVTRPCKQTGYSIQRAVWRAEFEQLQAAGAFVAPEHLQPGLQGALDLVEPLSIDDARVEAG